MARLQVIVYSKATGRVRRVIDPERDVTDLDALLASIGTHPGEAITLYEKGEKNRLHEWQTVASRATGKRPIPLHPEVDAHVVAHSQGLEDVLDRYVEVDLSGRIVAVHYADPSCGDLAPSGGVLVLHAEADEQWGFKDGAVIAPNERA